MPRALGFTLLALVAFAANSLLARAAIGPGVDGSSAIGPVAFTALRLAAGALVLWPWWRPGRRGARGFDAPGAVATPHAATPARRIAAGATALVAYALPFSLAYVTLGAATGALLLFGAVQLTMIGAGLRAGERLGPLRVAGLIAAFVGLVVLLPPAGQPASRRPNQPAG